MIRNGSQFARCIVAMMAIGPALAAHADDRKFTDRVVGPGIGTRGERKPPRGLGMPGLFDQRNRVQTAALDVESLKQEDALRFGGPSRTGIVQEFAARTDGDGLWTQMADGGWLWTLTVHATGARGVRVRIPIWRPPIGAELGIYNAADPAEFRGPITGSFRPQTGVLWTPTIYGEEVRLEYYLPPQIDHRHPANHIVVDGVVNEYAPQIEPRRAPAVGQQFAQAGDPTEGGSTPNCPGDLALACHQDMACNSTFQTEANGVGGLSFVSNSTALFCSGGMLNRVPEDFDTLFMTATHCGITDANADTVLVTWLFQDQTCGGCDAPAIATLAQTLGSTVLVRDEDTDWTLLGLTSDLPGGLTWLGWDANGLSNDEPVTGIHHPQGSFKRISFGQKVNNNGTRPDFNNLPACQGGSAHRVEWSSGLTEPGSSGSPIFANVDQRVRGTLSCGNTPSCGGPNNSSYGRLDQAFDLLEPWLDPVDPVFVDNTHNGDEVGTAAEPFDTILEGAFAVIAGSDLFIEAGTYGANPTIDRPMVIHSRNGVAVIGN